MKKILPYVLAGMTAVCGVLYPVRASAETVLRAVKGPTRYQVDNRLSYSKNNKDVETVQDVLIMKDWRYDKNSGRKHGGMFSVSIPHKSIQSPATSNEGLGDISVYGGPIGRIPINDGKNGDLHWAITEGITLPTGDFNAKLPLGNGRLDIKNNIAATWLSPGQKHEVDFAAEFTLTGRNKKGVNPPNEFYTGLVGGGKISKDLRAVAGFTESYRGNGDFIRNFRVGARYIPRRNPKGWNLETYCENGLKGKGISEATTYYFFYRRNRNF